MNKFILLLGDNCEDIYYYGNVNRISPEAPIPILDFKLKETHHGMAANVWQNLQELGMEVVFITTGRSTKTRFIDLKSDQQLLRLDDDPPRDPVTCPNLHGDAKHNWDAVVISDYNKGSITYDTIEYVISHYNGPIFIDTKKKDLKRFESAIIKINAKEYSEADTLPNSNLIVTHGTYGAVYDNQIFDSNKVNVLDVCGAGDTFFAALVYQYLETKDLVTSIKFANVAASITVQKMGVYAPTLKEINEAMT